MKIRIENVKNFYPVMQRWADDHQFILPHEALMPWDIFVLSNEKGIDQYCVGLWIASHVAITAFPLSNLDCKPNVKNLYKLYEYLETYIKKLNEQDDYNIGIFWTTAGTEGYKKFLEKNNWSGLMKNEDHYIKMIE